MDHPASNWGSLINFKFGYTPKNSILIPYHRFGHCTFRDGDGVEYFLIEYKTLLNGSSGHKDFNHGYRRNNICLHPPAQEETKRDSGTKAEGRSNK